MCKTTTVYLLHFDRPFGHAKHYLGSTTHLARRLGDHRTGHSSSKFMNKIHDAGIGFQLARVWKGDKQTERKLKNQGGASRICPVCKSEKTRILAGNTLNE